MCCGYGLAGTGPGTAGGGDCLIIPGMYLVCTTRLFKTDSLFHLSTNFTSYIWDLVLVLTKNYTFQELKKHQQQQFLSTNFIAVP
jgi:hypothetical protein